MLVYAVLVLMRCAPGNGCESTASASTVYAHDCRSSKSSSSTAITPLPSWLGCSAASIDRTQIRGRGRLYVAPGVLPIRRAELSG